MEQTVYSKGIHLLSLTRKTLLRMKLTALLLASACVHLFAAGFSQTITLSLKKAPLIQLFSVVEQQSDFRFVYVKEQLDQSIPISIHIKNAYLETVLSQCFIGQPLSYTIDGRIIVIQKKEEQRILPQMHSVKGKITNTEGVPLAGITVTAKGINVVTTTDINGVFILTDIEANEVLLISGAEIADMEVKVNSRDFIDIKVSTKVSTLDETIIKGYYTTSRRLNTGSVSRISSKEIGMQPVANPLSTMQGRVSGVFINTENGLPGGNITIQIRGKGSINAGTDPLYIVDGTPFIATPLNAELNALSTGVAGATSPLSCINPADIESIEVLKDADATAIYGTRGANGVVLISTKKGKAGKSKLDINLYTGVSRLSSLPKLLNLQQYLAIRREAFANDGIIPTAANAPDLITWDTTRSTDWMKYLMGGTAITTQAQAEFSGGNESTHFLLSGNYRNEGTVLRGDLRYQRAGMHMQLHHQAAENKFSLDFSASYSADNNRQLSSGISSAFTLPPNIALYKPDGSYSWEGFNAIHPAAVMKRTSTSITDNLLSNLQLKYIITPGLSVKTALGYTKASLNQVMTFPSISLNPNFGESAYAYYGNNSNRIYIIEPQLEFSKGIDKLGINSIIGFSWQNSVREGSFISGTDYSNEALLENPGAAGTLMISGLYNQYKYASIFGRLNFTWQDKYLLNITMRRDGSSRFGPGKQFGNFGAAGLAWIFSNEKLIRKNIPWLDYGKLRASYGITGNDLIRDYQYLTTYGTGMNYQGIRGITPVRIANADFGWENNKKAELALELGLLHNKVSITAAWYNNHSGNQLLDYPLSFISGPFGSYQSNFPALIENKGWEFDLTTNLVRQNEVTWSVTGNISIPKNRLVRYPGLAASSYAYAYELGKDLSIQKGLDFTGIDQQTGLPVYADINKDGSITIPEDYIIVGKTSPGYFGGAGSSFHFRQFDINIFFQFSKQAAQGSVTIPGTRSNKFAIAATRWQKPGDVTTIARATTAPSESYFNLIESDIAFYNASYTRLKNFTVSYSVKESLLNKLKIQRFRIYTEAQNLFTWRKRANLFDPETANAGIAPLKTLVAGLQLTF